MGGCTLAANVGVPVEVVVMRDPDTPSKTAAERVAAYTLLDLALIPPSEGPWDEFLSSTIPAKKAVVPATVPPAELPIRGLSPSVAS